MSERNRIRNNIVYITILTDAIVFEKLLRQFLPIWEQKETSPQCLSVRKAQRQQKRSRKSDYEVEMSNLGPER